MNKKQTIALVSNSGWFHYAFNFHLIKKLSSRYTILIISENDGFIQWLQKELDFRFYPIQIDHKGSNPFKDFRLTLQLYKIYKSAKPDIILSFTIKPNIYGTMAAWFLAIPTINQVTGLGTAFIRASFTNLLARSLYRESQKLANVILFLNEGDRTEFCKYGKMKFKKTELIPGAGVDMYRFKRRRNYSEKKGTGLFIFTFIGRVIKDKGIMELISASKKFHQKYPEVVINIIGQLGVENTSALTEKTFYQLLEDSGISYLGEVRDVAPILQDTDCVVLPSYREGTSKVLLEAAAMEIPIVTTDVPGCNNVVTDGFNGLLCRAKDPRDLFDKMEKMYLLPISERQQMGQNGRKLMIEKFDEKIVIATYTREIDILLNNKALPSR